MPGSERSFRIFSGSGLKFLLLELFVVFTGVYLAFLFQSYTENQKIHSESEKILVGLKEDLEYFRVSFPGFSAVQQSDIVRWETKLAESSYEDYSDWRFIQPQYNYTVIEYALDAKAGIIDYELNTALSKIYRELKKLEYAEEHMTRLAMDYRPLPDLPDTHPEIKIIKSDNFHGMKLLRERAVDRANIMARIAGLSGDALELINAEFSMKERKEIELLLIRKHLEQSGGLTNTAQTKAFIKNYFPHLSDEEIDSIFE